MIELENLNIKYDNKILIEDGSISFYRGMFHLITGVSGCGKSTLLYRIGLISEDINYKYYIDGNNIQKYNDIEKSYIRCYHMSYVLQDYSLFEQYDVLGNLQLYSDFIKKTYTEREFSSFLSMVHLNVPLHQSITTLSGGERQRLAIACALCKDSEIFILDEPTNSLDEDNSKMIFEVLRELAYKFNKCVIVSSHSTIAKEYADIIYKIQNNKLLGREEVHSDDNSILPKCQNKIKSNRSFYNNYIKYFFKKYKKHNVLIIIIMMLTLLFSLLSINIINYYVDKSKEAIINIGDNQMFITNSNQNIYVDDLEQVMSNEIIQRIASERECSFISPYIQLSSNYLGVNVIILPYYNQNDFTLSELCRLGQIENKGLYLSYNFYTLFTKNNNDLHNIELELEVSNYNENQKDIQKTKKSFPINAALKKGVTSPYYQRNGYYIYMYYKDIINIYNEFYDSGNFLGYTIFTDDYQDLLTLQNKINKLPIGINNNFIDAASIDKIINMGMIYQNISIIAIMLIFSALLIVIQMNCFYKRDREYALLKINGLNHNDLIILTMIETIFKLLISMIISLLLYGLILIMLEFLGLSVGGVNIYEVIKISIICFSIIILSELVTSYIYLRNMVPESVLRK